MEMAIFKYPLTFEAFQSIYVPEGARIIHFDKQVEIPTLWIEVDPTVPTVQRHFRMLGTGHAIPTDERLVHVGTALFNSHTLVWHLYEVTQL